MNRFIISIILISITAIASSCQDDFLERYPLANVSPETFFTTAEELRLYTNSFYTALPSYNAIYGETFDNVVQNTLNDETRGSRVVPASGGGWSWGQLRNINFFLEHSHKCEDLEAVRRYNALARFFRAYFYYDKVRRFGDVPWYNTALNTGDEDLLTKPRDSRVVVIDSVMADLDYAIDNLPETKMVDQISKWTALALKSRIALFEGTFRKYHTEFSLPKAEDLLDQSISASEQLMEENVYTVYTSGSEESYNELFTSASPKTEEIILAIHYNADLNIYHSANWYTLVASAGRPGLEKKLIDSFLMSDGSRFTDLPDHDTMSFYEETQNRDPRLSQIIRTPGYTRRGQSTVLAPNFSVSITGYQPIKYVTEPAHDANLRSTNPLPVFRFGEVLLNYAEAKAERGTISQEELDLSINRLRERAGMPGLSMGTANTDPDSFLSEQYPNVTGANKGLILEIRRERRIELVMEGFRRDDLMRWKEGHLLAEPFMGMYFPGAGEYDLDQSGSIDLVIYEDTMPSGPSGAVFMSLGSEIDLENGESGGQVWVHKSTAKTFNEDRDYLYPLPTEDLQLNPNLVQNPNW
ncbi:RagB/SusD family nutrient uptake outer membrane protein [Algoriphagus sp. AGSA1]|uniref:RagB/SusD family nutrient uptake outer membrane protein n=1 Tax=Algoriphagus sp. AGSA1 TaxID=2907213 RepID=UPI001F3E9EB9|nr:RagB/SusD family nutrient uptake outer membrane protein [Algoriphagus sp. AGSA1]MCE7057344.1 RagB/SusD family nutrient uptake outer membrane protein [Algoriphagus sp. AGSA1]